MEEWVKYKEGTFTVEERIHSTREYRTKEQDPAKDIEDALKADLKRISDATVFYPRTFQDMAYYGSVNSKRNTYHIYKYGESFLIMTNIRDKMNYNIYNFDELDEIMKYILDNGFYSRSFSGDDLVDSFSRFKPKTPRSKTLQNHYLRYPKKGLAPRWYTYLYFLSACYILSALGWLDISREGQAIVFSKGCKRFQKSINPLKQMTYIASDGAVHIYRDGRFYYTIRDKGNRGSLFPYLHEEIAYLKDYIAPFRRNQKIDITKLHSEIDYSRRFHEIYALIAERNIRNDREEEDYFERRLKAALQLIAVETKLIRREKEGRSYVFYKE